MDRPHFPLVPISSPTTQLRVPFGGYDAGAEPTKRVRNSTAIDLSVREGGGGIECMHRSYSAPLWLFLGFVGAVGMGIVVVAVQAIGGLVR